MRKYHAQEITELGQLLSRLFRNPRCPEVDWEALEALVGDLQDVIPVAAARVRVRITAARSAVGARQWGPARWELGQARRIVIGLAADHRPAA